MKKSLWVFVMGFAFLFPIHAEAISAQDQIVVLRDIRYMIYDEIHIQAQHYLNTNQAESDTAIQAGQAKIVDLQNEVKGYFGGNDAPNSIYQQAVTTARQYEADQITHYFTTQDEQSAVENVFTTYAAKGIQGQ
jgi:hypothetical protein